MPVCRRLAAERLPANQHCNTLRRTAAGIARDWAAVHMPRPFTTVFLSSTARDLHDYREASYRAIQRLDGFHCVRMEEFGASAMSSPDLCLAKLTECDCYVGIIGHLYGANPQGQAKSFTELEYDAAV